CKVRAEVLDIQENRFSRVKAKIFEAESSMRLVHRIGVNRYNFYLAMLALQRDLWPFTLS
ncbi:MAG: hypothetical protein WBL41_15000, partial [Terracidiphilus sp.]